MTINKRWFTIILIYLIPLFLDQTNQSEELIWLIYIFPSVWLAFFYGLKGGLHAALFGTLIHGINEFIEIVYKHNVYSMKEVWSLTILTLVNITVAITIGRLVDKLKSEQHSLQKVIAKMEYMAYHDYLTGLPNRWHFEMNLKTALEKASKTNSLVAVLFVDLDRFKLINDSLGHAVGDQLLKDVSKRIQLTIKEEDCLARQGGDEFILFLTGSTTKKEIESIVSSIHQSIQLPFKIGRQEYFISSSIGISIYPTNGSVWDDLIQQADIAMYTAKENGGNGYQWYNSDMQQEIHDMVKIETQLRKALKQNEFTLNYQPLVDIKDGRIFGFEALIRWNNADLGMIPPSEFISLAEEIGMISQLGEWVLKEACIKAKTFSKICREPIQIAVNISSKQFQEENFVEIVQHVLSETKLPPFQLELEITESVSMDNMDTVITKLNSLKEMGISISIDDFGTGYSSISYLKYLPVNTLKIDRSFVQNMLNNTKDRALVESVISLAKSFGFNVIAEGVETEEQLELLKSFDCGYAQGYLFSAPLPMKDLYRLFEENKKKVSAIEYVS
ncbi:putative bifunctional diguanylate cyclase/phosphodiesterase [Neobacillus drentensis]|jgi:diguanylate cyclase (GGDEF)-like protein|uniref:putative bifunctional diguanylate cyclase/phosphodiesterase n=1 Tax=Neobacillus drentensis TaxID=220684 RepID=UPI003000C8BA